MTLPMQCRWTLAVLFVIVTLCQSVSTDANSAAAAAPADNNVINDDDFDDVGGGDGGGDGGGGDGGGDGGGGDGGEGGGGGGGDGGGGGGVLSPPVAAPVELDDEEASIVDLYNSSAQLHHLDAGSFSRHVLGRRYAWLIQFYNSWCGHCQLYAPTWRQLAQRLAGWSSVVRVGAINCARQANVPVCRRHNVNGYPYVWAVAPHATAASPGRHIAHDRLDLMVQRVVHTLVQIQRTSHPPGWPHLDVSSGPLSSLLNEPAQLHVIVVELPPQSAPGTTAATTTTTNNNNKHQQQQEEEVEEEEEQPATLGQLLILDLSQWRGQMAVARRTAPLAETVVSTQLPPPPYVLVSRLHRPFRLLPRPPAADSSAAPSAVQQAEYYRAELMKMIQLSGGAAAAAGAATTTTVSQHHQQQQLQQQLQEQLQLPKPDRLGNSTTTTTTTTTVSTASTTEEWGVSAVDLEKAVHYAVTHEVLAVPVLSDAARAALTSFVRLLADHLPGQRPALHTALERLLTLLQRLPPGEGGEWLQRQMTAAPVIQFPSSAARWQQCRGSTPRYRGYTCALWMLFHSVTVAVAARHPLAPSPLPAIHGYVKHFFSCAECSQNFQRMAANDSLFQVASARQAALWLWRAHNKVNRRLSGTLTDDPRHRKRQFPSASQCGACRDANGAFNEQRVLDFLQRFYSVSPQSTETDFNVRLTGAGAGGAAVALLTSNDLSLSVLLWLFCVLTLVLAYKLVRMRRRRLILPFISRKVGF